MSLMQMAKTSQAFGAARRGGRPLRLAADRPDLRRRERVLRHARRRAHRRAGRPHRLRRAVGDRADHPPEAPRRFPDRRVPPRARDDRPGRAARGLRRSIRNCSSCTRGAAAAAGRPARAARLPEAEGSPPVRTPTRWRSATPGTSCSSPGTSSGRTRSTTSGCVFDDFTELHGDRAFEEDAGDRRRARAARRPRR